MVGNWKLQARTSLGRDRWSRMPERASAAGGTWRRVSRDGEEAWRLRESSQASVVGRRGQTDASESARTDRPASVGFPPSPRSECGRSAGRKRRVSQSHFGVEATRPPVSLSLLPDRHHPLHHASQDPSPSRVFLQGGCPTGRCLRRRREGLHLALLVRQPGRPCPIVREARLARK